VELGKVELVLMVDLVEGGIYPLVAPVLQDKDLLEVLDNQRLLFRLVEVVALAQLAPTAATITALVAMAA